MWDSSPVSTKEKIQKLVFAEGVNYNHQKGTFRTSKVNLVFAAIPQLNSISGDKQKQDGINTILFLFAGGPGQLSNLFMIDLNKTARIFIGSCN